MSDLMIYIIAACVCVFAVLSVVSRSIFHCAMFLAMTLLSIAGVYFYLEAQFLGIIQILVYVGGIITLFVFAIKLTAHMGDKTIRQTNAQILAAALVALGFLAVLLRLFFLTPLVRVQTQFPSITLEDLGRSLMNAYALPFEFVSVILLAAMVGAIVIGKEKS